MKTFYTFKQRGITISHLTTYSSSQLEFINWKKWFMLTIQNSWPNDETNVSQCPSNPAAKIICRVGSAHNRVVNGDTSYVSHATMPLAPPPPTCTRPFIRPFSCPWPLKLLSGTQIHLPFSWDLLVPTFGHIRAGTWHSWIERWWWPVNRSKPR